MVPQADSQLSIVLDLADAAATARFGRAIAARLLPGDLVLLKGELGAGKTTLARAILAGLGHPGEVPSPTFTLVQSYDTPAGPVAHADLYRVEDPDDLAELGLEEALAEGIVLLEWPERLGPALPEDAIMVQLAPGAAPEARHVTLTAGPGAAARLRPLQRAVAA